MKQGIIIIALGYPLYGNTAFNLALSIKNKCSEIPIAIAIEEDNHSISDLTAREVGFFDHYLEVPASFYTVGGKKQYQRAKLCLDLMAKKLGWDYVVYMDADNLWLDKPFTDLFDKLKEKDFHVGYNGEYNYITNKYTNKGYTYWAKKNEKEICKYHNIETILPQTVSGFLYFKAGDKADAIFKKAREIYDDPNAPTIIWANGKPDEYCINVSLALANYTQEKAHIFYFDKINNTIRDEDIYKNFWGFATGGNAVSEKLQHLYNRKVNMLCEQNNIPTRHYHVDKKDVIKERSLY